MGEVWQRDEDGHFRPAVPLGWQGSGIDWEVYTTTSPMRAEAYDEDVLVAVVTAKTRFGLRRKMRRQTRVLFPGLQRPANPKEGAS